MPAYGLIRDSPWIYWAQRAGRKFGRAPRAPRGWPPSIKFSFELVNVRLYNEVLYFELYHRSGMVGRHIHKIANRVQQGAKRQVGVKTGALKNSIQIEHFMAPGGAAARVGSKLPYAYLHHEGSRPHLILPKDPGGVLVFSKGARIITSRRVMHPGTKPNRYLSDQLRIYVTR